MNSKKVNWIFLAVVLTHILAVVALRVFQPVYMHMLRALRVFQPVYMHMLSIVLNFILSQLIVLVPVLAGTLLTRENPVRLAGFRRMKISSVLMTVLFTFLTTPLVVVINAVSMLFVDNRVVAMSGEILDVPFFIMLFLIGIFAPFSEELVFRGILYQGYKKSGTALRALLLSALLFSLMHMNLNQAAYAAVIGILLVFLVEAAGSLWGSVIFHVVFNSQQVCLMYLSDRLSPGMLSASQEVMTKDMLLMAISAYLILAAVTTVLAGAVLVWIAKNEKREENLRAFWTGRKNKTGERMVTVPLLIAVVICLSFMSLELFPV